MASTVLGPPFDPVLRESDKERIGCCAGSHEDDVDVAAAFEIIICNCQSEESQTGHPKLTVEGKITVLSLEVL